MVGATFYSADTSGTMGATIGAAAGKAKGPRKAAGAAPVIAADLLVELDAEPDEDASPKSGERAAWASLGVPKDENPLTPEHRKWIAEQAADEPGADDRGTP